MTLKNKISNFKSIAKKLELPLDNLLKIEKIIEFAGGSLKLVGGNVRDLILGKKITSEPDLTTDLTPVELVSCMDSKKMKYIKSGYDHGTITIIIDKTRFEITSLRRDIITDGRRAKVLYTKDWLEDAKRRDFTINSIYCDLRGIILDPYNGISDLENQRVIFIGNPSDRIKEDYLRILRFLRFSIKYSTSFDKNGLSACIKLKKKINFLSVERRILELRKVILERSFEENFKKISKTGILDNTLDTKIYDKNIYHLFLVERDFKVIDFQRRIKFFLRGTKNLTENIIINKVEKKFANRIKFRIKIDKSFDDEINRNLFLHGKTMVLDELIFLYIDGVFNTKRFREIFNLVKNWKKKKLPISGSDFMALGIKEGILIGKTLKKIEKWWITNEFRPKREECIKYLKSILLPR